MRSPATEQASREQLIQNPAQMLVLSKSYSAWAENVGDEENQPSNTNNQPRSLKVASATAYRSTVSTNFLVGSPHCDRSTVLVEEVSNYPQSTHPDLRAPTLFCYEADEEVQMLCGENNLHA
jgi:hypothetical protein